jgi:hypothetical protein
MPSPAAIRTATTRRGSPSIPSTNSWPVGKRFGEKHSPPSPRSPGSRTRPIAGNSTGWAALAETVIERHRRRPGARKVKHITIDLDPTDDPTHGAQQLTFFNGHYDTWCYLPMTGFLTFNREPDQYLFACVLRSGNAPAKQGAIGILERMVERLRAAFPRARILVRLDGGFAGPEMFDYLEDAKLDYLVAMAENKVLTRRAEPLMRQARRLLRASRATEHVYGECRYAAGTWKAPRRVLIKAEVVRLEGREPKDNARFVVTNLPGSCIFRPFLPPIPA